MTRTETPSSARPARQSSRHDEADRHLRRRRRLPGEGEVYRVAERHGLKVMWSATARSRCRASRGSNAWWSPPGWMWPTTGSPSARRGRHRHHGRRAAGGRAVKAGAAAIAPNGKPFDEDSIGMALATRNLMQICAALAKSPAGRSRSRRGTVQPSIGARSRDRADQTQERAAT